MICGRTFTTLLKAILFDIWCESDNTYSLILIEISRAPIDEGFQQEVVVAGDNVVTADGLAVDWIYHHLYWTDTGTNTINMANLAGLAKNQTSFGFNCC